jgi:hypothetical protein
MTKSGVTGAITSTVVSVFDVAPDGEAATAAVSN